jgi:heme/copper-type cytochrome/quinol oxidase subunit 1
MTITESPATTQAPSPTAPSSATAPATEEPTGLYGLVTSGDHKVIGRLYVGFAALFFVAVAVLGVLNGIERADTESIDLFDDLTMMFQSFWAYRLGLVFLVVLPLFVGLATAVVPMQVGSPAIAFPRAAAAAFWSWLVGSGLLIGSFVADGGLGELADGATNGDAVALTLVSLGLIIVALCLASVCIATTVLALRTPGMSLLRVPVFAWSMLVAATLWLLTLPVLLGDLVLTYVDYRNGQLVFGLPAAVNQQVLWAFWQPQVYAFAIPVLGIVGEIVPVAAKVRQRQHEVLFAAIALFGVFGFGAFARTLDVQDNFLYPAFGLLVLLPLLMVLGGIGDTLRQGRPSGKGPIGALLLATVGLLMLLAGAAGGALRVIDPFDLIGTSATDGVLNLVLLGSVAAGAAGAVYWSSKLTGRVFGEPLARTAALPLLAGIALVGIPDVISGFLDQRAGVFVGPVDDGVPVLNVVSLVGMVLVALGALAFFAGYARTLAGGPKFASNNPWQGHTLEWATVSPPPRGNFAGPLPIVRSERPLLDPAPDAATATGTDDGGAL